ncbi:MAG: hypothetical protein ABIZ91_18815 [Gemmatimonadaceae bacterium]
MTAAPVLETPIVGALAPDFTLPSTDGSAVTRFHANRADFLDDKARVLRWAFGEEHPGWRRTNTELLAEIARLA